MSDQEKFPLNEIADHLKALAQLKVLEIQLIADMEKDRKTSERINARLNDFNLSHPEFFKNYA